MGWQSIGAAVIGKLFGEMLFGGNDSAPAAPKVEPVTPMPTPNDAAMKAAKRKSIASMTARQGRASTILTSDDSTGGGSSTLGG